MKDNDSWGDEGSQGRQEPTLGRGDRQAVADLAASKQGSRRTPPPALFLLPAPVRYLTWTGSSLCFWNTAWSGSQSTAD